MTVPALVFLSATDLIPGQTRTTDNTSAYLFQAGFVNRCQGEAGAPEAISRSARKPAVIRADWLTPAGNQTGRDSHQMPGHGLG